ncbi:hypothetical protein K7711_36365 [Nocardia sp. CA2R105]|uniref:hypothetical protein n=1 Tax=Nocardia coffeae TaxID=2873381 RepID=UPI001CA784B1|nr:hypothetical protein [Nocardia coffeae]MBY8861998.1 hypothetical protein [Nocardia coffeae]
MPSRDRAHASQATVRARAVVVVALIPIAVFYLGPRIYNLVATPYRLDHAVVSASKYNPALDKIVDEEKVSLAAFDSLDKVKKALASVLATDRTVSAELNKLVDQITQDLQAILDHAGTNVSVLITSLDALSAKIDGLQAPSNGASTALSADRTHLAGILDSAHSTANLVHDARVSAETAANDLSGK